MKKRNFETKIITGLLTAGMILSLTACGSSSNGSYGISDLMDADYAVASKEAAAPEASAYEDGFGMTEGYDSAGNAQDTSTTGCDTDLCGSAKSQGCPADGTGETVAAVGTGGEHRRHHYHRTAPVRCEIPAGKYGIPVEKL